MPAREVTTDLPSLSPCPAGPLLVILLDRLSQLIQKGEVTARYYNPGDYFDEVHILLTNDDQPDLRMVQKMVGRARLHLHNLPLRSFFQQQGWHPLTLLRWRDAGVALAQHIKPAVVRTHGAWLNGWLGVRICRTLHIPLVVSLHVNTDVDTRQRTPWWPHWRKRAMHQMELYFEKKTLRGADWVLPVYEPIRSYAMRRGARQIRICYNVLNPDHLGEKKDFSLHSPPRIISVGRQIPEKNPVNIIRALARIPAGELTLVGDGPMHAFLRQSAVDYQVADRVIFLPSVANDTLCRMLPDFDLFVTHSEYWEISKAVLEALLTGLPIILNRRRGEPVPELQGEWVSLVDDTPDDYQREITRLLDDSAARATMGRRAYRHAQEHYAPAKTEKIFADFYHSLLQEAKRGA
ncbi:MAG: glycosyltransferase family 4 protein [Magnetococcales bacterium]|nr:glycosyltransferase family 4 protein [Magnetococcales bacterium]